jgi:hypothetical protein
VRGIEVEEAYTQFHGRKSSFNDRTKGGLVDHIDPRLVPTRLELRHESRLRDRPDVGLGN